MNTHSPAAEWQPELSRPHIALHHWYELDPDGLNTPPGDQFAAFWEEQGRQLCADLRHSEHAQSIRFPLTHESTITDDRTDVRTMRYVPNLFLTCSSPAAARWARMYREVLPNVVARELSTDVTTLPDNARSAEALICNPAHGESLDMHLDSYDTVSAYPASGCLLVSHCRNARDPQDVWNSPATLVLAGAGTCVVFNGVDHPHIGVNPNLLPDDSDEVRAAKVGALYQQYSVTETISNLQVLTQLTQPPELDGDRLVVSMNFRRRVGGIAVTSAGQRRLDKLITAITR